LIDKKGEFGVGVWVQHNVGKDDPASAMIRSSVIERSRSLGLLVLGAQASIEATTIRDTLPDDHELFGYGLYVGGTGATKALPSVRSSATFKASLIERSH